MGISCLEGKLEHVPLLILQTWIDSILAMIQPWESPVQKKGIFEEY